MTFSMNKLLLRLHLLLLLGCLLFACDNKDRKTQLQPPEISPTAEPLAPEDVAVQVIAGDDTTIQSNSLMNSLVPEWSVQEVLRKVPEAKIQHKEAVPNRHIQGQVDTLVTVKSDSTIFQFYSLPTQDMLQSATLSKGGISIGSGIEIGMLAEEVAQRIPLLKGKKAIPQTIIIRAEQTPTSIRLRFKNNRLAFIDYKGYVD